MRNDVEPEVMKSISETSDGLRQILFDEINLLRQNKIPFQRANAIARCAAHIIDSMRLQILHGKAMIDFANSKIDAPFTRKAIEKSVVIDGDIGNGKA